MSDPTDWLEYSTPPDARNLETGPGSDTITVNRPPRGIWRAGLLAAVILWSLSILVTYGCLRQLPGTWFNGKLPGDVIITATIAVLFTVSALWVTFAVVDDSHRTHSLRVSPRGLQLISRGILGNSNRIWMRDEIHDLRINEQVHHTLPELLLIETTGHGVVVISDMPHERLVLLEESLRTILNLPPAEKR